MPLTSSEIIVSEQHIDPKRDDGYIIYKLGYIHPVSGGARQASMLWGNVKAPAAGGGGSETATTMGALIGSTANATPNDTDYVATALTGGGIMKKITWTNVKAFLKTYFDGIYLAAATYLGLTDTSDTTYTGKDKYVPVVNESTSKLDLTATEVATFFSLSDFDETTYTGKNGYIPQVNESTGKIKLISISDLNASITVVLGSDVTNNNAVANTIADVTGLSASLTANKMYWFKFVIYYTAAATSTGSRWAVNASAGTAANLSLTSEYSLTTTTTTRNALIQAFDSPAKCNATSAATTNNMAVIEGYFIPSANCTFIARFASEVSSSAIVAKAGSCLFYQQLN